jgi:hypothetical protein
MAPDSPSSTSDVLGDSQMSLCIVYVSAITLAQSQEKEAPPGGHQVDYPRCAPSGSKPQYHSRPRQNHARHHHKVALTQDRRHRGPEGTVTPCTRPIL